MIITAYAHGSKETMREIGEEVGLTGTVLENFVYALDEVAIELDVDEETSYTKIITVNGKTVS